MIKTAILTISDKGSRGEREDLSGKVARQIIEAESGEVIYQKILPDEQALLEKELVKLCDDKQVDLILTTGGTGLSPKDVTPEATQTVIEKEVPGISEAIRAESLKFTPHAMLSRAKSGTRDKTLIINLPGSPKAVEECLRVVLSVLPHAVEVISGKAFECASDNPT